jgi:hypothetical protein
VNNFDNYDLKKWLDRGLSRHPPAAAERDAVKRNGLSQMTRLIFPLVASASLFVLQGAAEAQGASQYVTVRTVQIADDADESIYWLGTIRDGSMEQSIVSGFEARATALAHQLREGSLINVPAKTLEYAAAMNQRGQRSGSSASTDWISEVSRAVSQLTD